MADSIHAGRVKILQNIAVLWKDDILIGIILYPTSMICYRCGICCRLFLAVIPKFETSDLSKKHLDTMLVEEREKYIDENCELPGEKCKWLDDTGIQCTCTAYARRSSSCETHFADQDCKVGLEYFIKKAKSGVQLPTELLELMKKQGGIVF